MTSRGVVDSDLRRLMLGVAPEDVGGVVVDFVEELVDGAGFGEIVLMPAAVAIGPIEGPVRHQLAVLQRQISRPRFKRDDRASLWVPVMRSCRRVFDLPGVCLSGVAGRVIAARYACERAGGLRVGRLRVGPVGRTAPTVSRPQAGMRYSLMRPPMI